MGRRIRLLLILFLFLSFQDITRAETATFKFSKDIDRDGKKELVIHDLFEGSAAYGKLRIYNNSGKLLFMKFVQGEPYLWHPDKHLLALNPRFFPDLDKDGIVEILIGRRGQCEHKGVFHCEASEPWWFDVYKWNGKTYILANGNFPMFYKNQLSSYRSFAEKKGGCETIKEFIEKAKRLSS